MLYDSYMLPDATATEAKRRSMLRPCALWFVAYRPRIPIAPRRPNHVSLKRALRPACPLMLPHREGTPSQYSGDASIQSKIAAVYTQGEGGVQQNPGRQSCVCVCVRVCVCVFEGPKPNELTWVASATPV